jgi:excinuclease UvrABC nuclease subunit
MKKISPQRIKSLLSRLRRQRRRRFPKKGSVNDAPNNHGVYIIFDRKRVVVHVGRTLYGKNGLKQRLRNHLYGQLSFVLSFLHGQGALLREGYSFTYLEVANPRERALLEGLATGTLCPMHIGIGVVKSH